MLITLGMCQDSDDPPRLQLRPCRPPSSRTNTFRTTLRYYYSTPKSSSLPSQANFWIDWSRLEFQTPLPRRSEGASVLAKLDLLNTALHAHFGISFDSLFI